jgi:hypothetical protein
MDEFVSLFPLGDAFMRLYPLSPPKVRFCFYTDVESLCNISVNDLRECES